MRLSSGIACLLVLFALALTGVTAETLPVNVDQVYPGLSSGPLRQATLAELPNGTLLHAGAVTITEKQLAAELAAADPAIRTQLTKHAFFLLEQLATKSLLLAEARAWAAAEKRKPGEEEDALLQAYLRSVAGKATITDEELKASYEENKEALGDLSFTAIEKELREYLLEEKRVELIDAYIKDVSARIPVAVAAGWLKAKAASSLDNPVDKARRAGKPALIDFGSDNCGPCVMMAPILKDLQKTLAGRCTVLVVNVQQEEVLSARYGVDSIPVQVFFDKDGKEVFRHVGFFPREKILEKLTALGVK